MKFKLMSPAGAMLIGLVGLTACSGPDTGAATQPAPAPAAAGSAATEDAAGSASGKVEEEPLTGQTKTDAEEAALADYPGAVKKSEIDAERPGFYAVEIEQDSGGEVEVYLDKQFNVVDTKDEPAGGDDDNG